MTDRPKTRRLPGNKLPDAEHLRAHQYVQSSHAFSRLKRDNRGIRRTKKWPDHLSMPGTDLPAALRSADQIQSPAGDSGFTFTEWSRKSDELDNSFKDMRPKPWKTDSPDQGSRMNRSNSSPHLDALAKTMTFVVILITGLAVIAFIFFRAGDVGSIKLVPGARPNEVLQQQ